MKVYQISSNNEKSFALATMDRNKRFQRKLGGKPNRQLAFIAAASILFTLFSCFQECICATDKANVQAPVFIEQPSSSSIVAEGRTKFMQCKAKANPQAQYKWMKDGIPLTEYKDVGFYKISNAARNDSGSYQCIAKNDVGVIFSEKSEVVVAYMEDFKDSHEQVINVESGKSVVLDMSHVESVPIPSVSWENNRGLVKNNLKHFITSNNQLIILSADSEDARSGYRARATNTQIGKEIIDSFIYLNITGSDSAEIGPEIILSLFNQQVVKGKTITLECVANARPLYEVEIIWFFNGSPIEESGLDFAPEWFNRRLNLFSVESTFEGDYECRAQMKTGGYEIKSSKAKLMVIEPPEFETSLQSEITGEYFSRIDIPCSVRGVPEPYVTWFENTEAIDLSSGKYKKKSDNTLVIEKLTQSGVFQCLASNEAGEKSSYVWVKVPSSSPVMEKFPVNVTSLDGQDVTFTCNAVGSPIPNTTWILNDVETLETSAKYQILPNGDLVVSNIREEDMGCYKCIRENESGAVSGEAFLIVLIRTHITQPPVDTTALLGSVATLQCKVSSDRNVEFNISWIKDKNQPIVANQRISVRNDGTLEISAVRASDVGKYHCMVSSPAGNHSRSATLSVVELPFPPENVKAQRLGEPNQRTVQLSWTASFDGNSPILKYIVQKREVSEIEISGPLPDNLQNWVTENINISTDQRHVMLKTLKAATSYQFRVSAINRVGEGTPSDPSNTVSLPHEVPSSPPTQFVASARSSSEIIVQWSTPLEEHRNGQILGYILRYKLSGYKDTPWTYANASEVQRNYLIQDLITWKEYNIQIAAFNNMGTGVYADEVKVKTKEGVPEAPPRDIKVKVLTSSSILISWNAPNPQQINGINQGYKIQATRITEANEKEIKTLKVAPNLINPYGRQNCTMTNLRKFTNYNITILCFTNPGDGIPSQPMQIKTFEDVPEEVSFMQFTGVSDRELTLKWSEPNDKNGMLTGYQVKYKVKDSGDVKVVNLTSQQTDLHVTQLRALTHYWFEIAAMTSKGLGKPKVAVIQSGIEPVLPEPPTNLALSNIEAFSVVIQFTSQFDGNSSIINWIVDAQTSRNDMWNTIYEITDPDANSITVNGLHPYTAYKLRITSVNVVGKSEPSEATKDFQTLQAKPKHSPYNVTVRAMSSTELRVRWIPLQQSEWYGVAKGYNISYRRLTERSDIEFQFVLIEDPTANSHILKNLDEWSPYEIVMTSVNEVGQSTESPIAIERTRESVPSSGPLTVSANSTSSTTIVVKWSEIPAEYRNGQIDGFKIFYGGSGIPVLQKIVKSNKTFTETLTELKKFAVYQIQVAGYTRLGDGRLSVPPIQTQTFEDTPSYPSNVSFPDVSYSTARIIWDAPEEPNGEILAYRVTYALNSSNKYEFTREFSPLDRTYRAANLLPEHFYRFTVTAQTRIGWGRTASVLVFTTNNRELPQAPSVPQISRSQIQSHHITFTWNPGRDGFSPLRYYTVQIRENERNWVMLPEKIDPNVNTYTVNNLKPHSIYQFRIKAINDLGSSPYSRESIDVRTLPAAPSSSITGLKVVPITVSSVQLEWIPLPKNAWNGDAEGGYKIYYQPIDDHGTKLVTDAPTFDVKGIEVKGTVLRDLTQDRNYEIVVNPYNSQGLGPGSQPMIIFVGEAVPVGAPENLEAVAISSTEVKLKWKPPSNGTSNGDLLGYKIFYTIISSPQPFEDGYKVEEEIEVVPAAYNSHSLVFLDKYTEYQIQILAFNPAGDGPRTKPVIARTLQGLPGAPENLTFSDITMNSLKVSWNPPKYKNGDVVGYVVSYETTQDDEKFSKQVKQKVVDTELVIHNLEEEVAYTFTVKAQTVDYGPAAVGNITTGPQDGSPVSPRELSLTKNVAYIDFHWVNGPSGRAPIMGFIIESKKRDDSKWQTASKSTSGAIQDFTVSFQTLLPSTVYTFRISSYNKYGISYPLYAEEYILTPSKLYLEYGYLQQNPFYRQAWFSMSVACLGTIMLILVTAVLCVKSKSQKYKQEAQKTLEESIAMSIDERQELALELYRSRIASTTSSNPTGTIGRSKTYASTKTKKSSNPSGTLGRTAKSPPRPSPASVAYHSDEESLSKCYDENPDDSSVTEKPSEISSSESQHSESENESVRSDGTSFVNHYANVNNTLKQSWKKQHPMRNYSSYTDSEQESSAQVNLNGGRIIMNNKARSRAPLPGFSSFV